LAQSGVEVIFIARGAHLHAIRDQGLHIQSPLGDFVLSPAQATDNPTQVGPVDVVLVGVKTWQIPAAIDTIRPLLDPETGVIPLLNGVEAADQLAAALGRNHVLGGLCKIFAFITEPGHIRHAGIDPSILFGELDNRSSPRARKLYQTFLAAGVRATIPTDIHVALWEKFLFGASTSGLGAVTRAPMNVLRELSTTRQMLEEAMHEILAVAHARSIALPSSSVSEAMALVDSLPVGTTASMQRDIMAGRPSELEAQNGAVTRLGGEAGVATPLHSFIYTSLLPQELYARGPLHA
jgi:2-dehydropantoate 2-reductase